MSHNGTSPIPVDVLAWLVRLVGNKATGQIQINVKDGKLVSRRLVPPYQRLDDDVMVEEGPAA